MISRTKNNFGDLDVWGFMAIICLGLALYYIPLHSTFFCLDDSIAIEHNQAIKQIDVPKIFTVFNTRFLPGLTFALNYQWCALNPAGYRFINLLIHCFNAFLVYLLIKSTLTIFPARKTMLFCRLEWVAFLGSVLFLCHPIQTEPVNYITQRFVLMGAFFYLLTLYLYIQYRCRQQKTYMIACQAAAIAAMLCKEFAVTLPLMLVVYEFYFINSLNEGMGKRLRRLTPFFIIALIVPLLLLRTPSQAVGVANIAGPNITMAHRGIDRRPYFLTELNVVSTYVRLLFLPVNQNFDYDYPISYAIDGKTLMSGVFLLCLLAMAGITYNSCRIVSFSILWFFIALSVESSFIPIGNVIAEYRLYLASAGFVFLVMTVIYMKPENQKKFYMMAGIICVAFSLLTYQRNEVWKDGITLWNDTIRKSPHKARPYLNRGNYYLFKQGNLEGAMSDYNKSIEVDPNYIAAYCTLADLYFSEGKFNQAIMEYSKAIMIKDPNYLNKADLYYNRGVAYFYQGRFTQALSDLYKAKELGASVDPGLIAVFKKASVRNP